MPDNVVAWDSTKSGGIFTPVAQVAIPGGFAAVIDTNVADIADIVPGSAKAQGAVNLASDVGSRPGGVPLAFPNLLTNGGMEVKQRAATSNAASGAYLLDGWACYQQNTSTFIQTQIASTIGSKGFSSQVAFTFLAAGVTQTSENMVENAQLLGATLSLRATIKSTVIGTVRAFIYDNLAGFRFSPFNISIAAEKLSVTAPITVGATIIWAGVYIDIASCTVEINDLMLVDGSVPVDFVPMHVADELARCMRFYEMIPSDLGGNFRIMSVATAGGQPADCTYGFKAHKAVNPTITKVGSWTGLNCGQPVPIGGNALDSVVMEIISTAAGSYYTNPIGAGQNITVEANP